MRTVRAFQKNNAEAMAWFRKAADQGYAGAQRGLGAAFYLGEGVPQNYVNSYMWYSLGKALGDDTVESILEVLREKMTAADISKAQRLASEWWEARGK